MSKYLISLAVVVLALHYAQAVQFRELLTKQADSCANDLWNFHVHGTTFPVTPKNCIQAGRVNQEPHSSNLILIPARDSSPDIPQNQGTNTPRLTIIGSGFDSLVPQGNVAATLEIARLCLGHPTPDPARYCVPERYIGTGVNRFESGCDESKQIVPVFWVAGPDSDTHVEFNIPLAGTPTDWNSNTATSNMELEDIFQRPLCWTPTTPATGRGPLLSSPVPPVPLSVHFPPTTYDGGNLITGPTPPTIVIGAVPQPPSGVRANFIWTGFTYGVVFDCHDQLRPCTIRSTLGLTELQAADIKSRTQCCRTNNLSWLNGAQVGVCINPNTQTCCGGTPVEKGVEKCCWNNLQSTAFVDGVCRCLNNTMCSNGGLNRESLCCTPTKYPEAVLDVRSIAQGQCFDPARHQCCNTGHRYDPGTHQCCAINGLQNVDQPCPCNSNADCSSSDFRCCRQEAPHPVESDALCTPYANYPLGIGSSAVQKCQGVCINRWFQICCNGNPCVREYDQCCNNTCCNKFTGSCLFARRFGSPGFPSNNLEAFTQYEQCSKIEHLDTVKAFLMFALPAILLISALSVLALALVFANKSSARIYSLLERVLIVCAVLAIFLSFPLFFSHLYKYAEVIVLVSIVSIFTAAVRLRWLNIFAIALLAITVIYLFDPFYGNAWLTLAYGRTYDHTHYFRDQHDSREHFEQQGLQDPDTSGLLHTTAQLFFNTRQTLEVRACTTFYDYFILDQSLLDVGRIHNPEVVTFGYCSRAYVIALLFFGAFAALFILLQFVLAMLALIVRFRKQRVDPVEIEVLPVPVYPVY